MSDLKLSESYGSTQRNKLLQKNRQRLFDKKIKVFKDNVEIGSVLIK